jgi:hypothetical protein
MAGKLNIAALAARLGELNQPRGGGGGGMSFVDIKDGRNQVRLLPGKDDPNEFYVEVWVHYGVGKTDKNSKGTMLVCPKTHNENAYCPVCELSSQLKKMSKKKDDNYDKQAKSVYRKKRVYFNAIDRAEDLSKYEKDGDGKWINKESGDEESPVKVLGSGVEVFKAVLGLLVDPDYGDIILDTADGLDLIITKTGSGQFNTSYDVKAARKESVVGFDLWQEALNDLKSLAKVKTAAEIEAIMNGEDPNSGSESEEGEDKKDDGKPVDISDPDYDPDTEAEGDKGAKDAEQDALQDEIQQALARRRGNK